MIKIEPHILWLSFLLPVFVYAEIHYKIWNIFSRYFKREPEIVADVPHRLGPGKKLPVFLCIKDADRFPVELDTVHIEMLNDAQKIRLCEICGELRADWVKTSTGYAPGGATDHDLKLMRQHSPEFVQVKAAGGVRSLDRLLEVRALGVTRVGATATIAILDEVRARLEEG